MFYFRWINTSNERHPHWDLSGNDTFKHHLDKGAIEAIKVWAKNETHKDGFTIIFATGICYLGHIRSHALSFIIQQELESALW